MTTINRIILLIYYIYIRMKNKQSCYKYECTIIDDLMTLKSLIIFCTNKNSMGIKFLKFYQSVFLFC